MYAVNHIKRVLKMYPNTFAGIGEFSIHKEFVSSKISGEAASLENKALIVSWILQPNLVLLPYFIVISMYLLGEKNPKPAYASQMYKLLKRHKNATVIWAHMGLGRIVRPHARDLMHAKGRTESKSS